MKDIKFIEKELKKHFYEKLQYNIIVPITQTELDVAYDVCLDELLARLRIFLAGKEIVESTEATFIDVYNDWTEEFKSKFFPIWLIRLFPIKYRKIQIQTINKLTRICPHITLPNQNNTHFEWLEYGKVVVSETLQRRII
jgi:hypothetical protein